MAQIYYDLIKKGLYKIENVPERWKEEVENLLKEN